ncbi:MAG: hypothetical protein ABEK03_02955 [Candidatus Bipolaricaulia bacterium]
MQARVLSLRHLSERPDHLAHGEVIVEDDAVFLVYVMAARREDDDVDLQFEFDPKYTPPQDRAAEVTEMALEAFAAELEAQGIAHFDLIERGQAIIQRALNAADD